MMLDVPVPRVPMLRARLLDSRRGGGRMSVNAVDWALRFAPVDARHNGAARVLMCLANVADDEGRNAHPTHRKLAAWCKCSVSTVKRHLSWLEANADPSRRPTPGRAFQRVAPARRVGSVPGEPSGARPRLLRLERHRRDPRRTARNGKPRPTREPWFRHGI